MQRYGGCTPYQGSQDVDGPRLDLSEPFAVKVDRKSLSVTTTHDDDGWMAREIRTQMMRSQRIVRSVQPTARSTGLRLDQTLQTRVRGISRERRSRQTRRTSRVGSSSDPPRSDDDDPDVVLLVAGVVA
jgi:hypothetical protein